MPTSIDDIILGSSAQNWFNRNAICPSSWGLNEHDIQKIIGSSLRLTIMYSPASLLPLPENRKSIDLVMCNATLLNENLLSKEEFIAVLLHEIGHIVNKPDGVHAYIKEHAELFADDYVRLCKYDISLVSALRELRNRYPVTFGKENIETRIKRIEDNAPLLVNNNYKSIAPQQDLHQALKRLFNCLFGFFGISKWTNA